MSRFFLDDVYYFITTPTIGHQKFFDTCEKKNLILNKIIQTKQLLGLDQIDFGINSNHYHLLVYFEEGDLIPKFLNYINGGSSFELNKMENEKGRKVWDEYHIYYVNNESVLYKVRGYVIGNPYKHQEILSLEELAKYPFSSFKDVAREIGTREAENIVLSVIGMSDKDIEKELKLVKELDLPKGSLNF